jgi:surface antigen
MKTRTLTAGVAGLIIATGAVAGPAQANRPADDGGGGSYATGVVKVNKGYTLSVRSAPQANAPVVRELPRNHKVRIACQTTGDQMTGRFGTSNVWDKLAKGGYVTDTYVYTGSDGRVAEACGGGETSSEGGGGGKPASITGRDDYPFANGSWHEADPWAFYKRECVSFVAYRLNKVMKFSNFMRGGHFGNAMNWDDNARAIGMKVDRRPTVGSVMVRNSGTYGHVAMVAKVAPGRIFVEQYNAGGTHTYSKQWLDVTSYMAFIHPKGR